MIGLIYTFVLGFGIFQLAFFLILALPMPKGFKDSFTRFLESPNGRKLQNWQKYALFVIILLFMNSIYFVSDSKKSDITGFSNLEKKEFHIKRLYAERNLYLTGSCLILTFALITYFYETRKYYELKGPIEQLLKNDGIKLDSILNGKSSLDAELSFVRNQKQAHGEQVKQEIK